MRKRLFSFLVLIVLALGFSTIMISSIQDNELNKIDSGETIVQGMPSLRTIEKDEIKEPSIKKPQFSVQSVQSEFPEPTVEILQFNDHEMDLRGYGNDTIRFNIEFRSAQRAWFNARAELFSNETGTPISVSRVAYWNDWVDPNTIRVASIDICGYDIRENGKDGPYNVSLLFTKDNGTIYTIYDYDYVHTTKPYFATDFVESPVSLLSVTDNFIDNDVNTKYEWIDLSITLNVTIPSDYYFQGYIQQSGGGPSDGATNRAYLSVGTHEIILRFAGWPFQDMSTTTSLEFYSLFIQHDTDPHYEVYDEDPGFVTGIYDPSEFDIPPINVTGNMWGELIDSDGDGPANYYRVTIEVNKTRIEDGQFSLYANLYKNTTDEYIDGRGVEWNETLMSLNNVELVNVTINFNGIRIYKSGITNDNFLVKDISTDYYWEYNWGWIDSSSISWISETPYSYTQFEEPGASLTDNFNDYGVDTDGDTLYNELVVEVEVDVSVPGDYNINGDLTAPSIGNSFAWANNHTYLSVGFHWVQLRFDGIDIFRSGVNDTLELIYISLYGGDPWTQLDSNYSVILSHYVFTEFDPPNARFTGIYSDQTADTNGDGLWDELQIFVEVEINIAGYYRVEGDLRNPITDKYDYVISEKQYCGVEGTYSFLLRYSGNWIWEQRTKTTYILSYVSIIEVDEYDNWIKQWDYRSNPFTTDYVYDSNDFNPPVAYITGIIDEYVIDLNSDGLYDRWRVVFEIQIMEKGTIFYFYTQLVESGSYDEIASHSKGYSNWPIGIHNITIDFRCDQIYQSGFSGGAKISYYRLELISEGETYYEYPDYQLTGNYDWDDFSPDCLIIEQVWPEPWSTFDIFSSIYFKVDIAKTPSITISSTTITIDIQDDQYIIELNLASKNPNHEQWGGDLVLDYEGLWHITINVTGSDGLIDSLKIVIYVGNSPVFKSFASSFPSVMLGGTVQFIVYVGDFDGLANVSLFVAGIEHPMEFIAYISYIEVWKGNVTFNELGQFKVHAKAEDMMGLKSESEDMTIFVNEGPEIITVEVTPGKKVELGTTLTFTAYIMKSDAIITSVQVEVKDGLDNLYTVALEKSDETDETEIYSGTFTPDASGQYICTLRVMDTRDRVSTYETTITILGGDEGDKISPGFELIIILIIFTILPVGRKHFQRKKILDDV